MKNSSAKKVTSQESVKPSYNVEDFVRAIRCDNVDYIIGYVKSGSDVNEIVREITTNYTECGSDFIPCGTRTEVFAPLDKVRNSDIERYLRCHGALTLKEIEAAKKLQAAEEERLCQVERERLRKENEERIRASLNEEL